MERTQAGQQKYALSSTTGPACNGTHFLQRLKPVMKSQIRSLLPYLLLLAAASTWSLVRSSRHAAIPPSDERAHGAFVPGCKYAFAAGYSG